ncbi:MAG TPA: alcohol dehydrogenase catalytic domain-containing protein [Planctomycetota bacterium]|nr:alcohol dehydrogenase catalytic domain-containing protein [Planctomycetota bacterium]
MQAVVYRGRNRLRVEDVPDPKIEQPRDAIVRITLTTICGTDIHLVNGTIPGMKKGTILGHECVGVIEDLGEEITNLSRGDRVVVLSTIACGRCDACKKGHFAHCLETPVAPGTYFFGSPAEAGSLNGMQADFVRVPFADVGCVKIPDALDDVAALAASDIMPTAFFGLDRLELEEGQNVVILGAGPVGQMAVAGAHRAGCAKIIVVDREESRLDCANRFPEVETVDYSSWFGPVKEVLAKTGGQGADAVLDCVGVDASSPWGFHDPGRAIQWASEIVRPEGRFGIIGIYPEVLDSVPLGVFLEKNISITGGNCNHKAFIDDCLAFLVEHPEEGREVFTHRAPLADMPDAYDAFVAKKDGMIKCLLLPETSPALKKEEAVAAVPSL